MPPLSLQFPARSASLYYRLVLFAFALTGTAACVCAANGCSSKKNTKAAVSITKDRLREFRAAVTRFKIRNGRYPSGQEGLQAPLVTSGKATFAVGFVGGCGIGVLPCDAWGNPFRYVNPGKNGAEFSIISNGPDQIEDTSDDIVKSVKIGSPYPERRNYRPIYFFM